MTSISTSASSSSSPAAQAVSSLSSPTKESLAWFSARRKRWENAPRHRVVPLPLSPSKTNVVTTPRTTDNGIAAGGDGKANRVAEPKSTMTMTKTMVPSTKPIFGFSVPPQSATATTTSTSATSTPFGGGVVAFGSNSTATNAGPTFPNSTANGSTGIFGSKNTGTESLFGGTFAASSSSSSLSGPPPSSAVTPMTPQTSLGGLFGSKTTMTTTTTTTTTTPPFFSTPTSTTTTTTSNRGILGSPSQPNPSTPTPIANNTIPTTSSSSSSFQTPSKSSTTPFSATPTKRVNHQNHNNNNNNNNTGSLVFGDGSYATTPTSAQPGSTSTAFSPIATSFSTKTMTTTTTTTTPPLFGAAISTPTSEVSSGTSASEASSSSSSSSSQQPQTQQRQQQQQQVGVVGANPNKKSVRENPFANISLVPSPAVPAATSTTAAKAPTPLFGGLSLTSPTTLVTPSTGISTSTTTTTTMTKGLFGPIPVFGSSTSSTTTPPTATSTPGTTKSNPFASFSKPSGTIPSTTTTTTPLFGALTTTTPPLSATTTTTTPMFGTTTSSTKSGLFGAISDRGPKPNPFAASTKSKETTTTTTNPPSSTAAATATKPIFGTKMSTTTQSGLFGATSATTTTKFTESTTSTTTKPVFGVATTSTATETTTTASDSAAVVESTTPPPTKKSDDSIAVVAAAAVQSTSSAAHKTASRVFDQFDTKQSGSIPVSMLEDMIDELGEGFHGDEFDAQVTQMDPSKSGMVQRGTFIDWYTTLVGGDEKKDKKKKNDDDDDDDDESLDSEAKAERFEEELKARGHFSELATKEQGGGDVSWMNVVDFGKLLESLGTTYCEEEHRRTLKKLTKPGDRIYEEDFIEWYIGWLFDGDESDIEDDGDDDDDDAQGGYKKSSGGTGSVKTSGWGDVFQVDKDSWKCEVCSVRNQGSVNKCPACETARPGYEEESGVATDGTESSKTSMGAAAIGSGGFSFGSGAVGTGGSTFGATPKGDTETKGAEAPKAGGGFLFGTSTGQPGEGVSFGKASTANDPSSKAPGFSFGGSVVSGSGFSFGGSSPSSATPPMFGTTTSTTKSGLFGGTPDRGPKPNPFVSPSKETAPSSTTTTPAATTPMLGTTASTTKSGLFGGTPDRGPKPNPFAAATKSTETTTTPKPVFGASTATAATPSMLSTQGSGLVFGGTTGQGAAPKVNPFATFSAPVSIDVDAPTISTTTATNSKPALVFGAPSSAASSSPFPGPSKPSPFAAFSAPTATIATDKAASSTVPVFGATTTTAPGTTTTTSKLNPFAAFSAPSSTIATDKAASSTVPVLGASSSPQTPAPTFGASKGIFGSGAPSFQFGVTATPGSGGNPAAKPVFSIPAVATPSTSTVKDITKEVQEEPVSTTKTETTPPSEEDSQAASTTTLHYRDRLTEFYKKYNPRRLDKVDETLASYRGKEDELFRKLEEKYVKGKDGILPPGGEGPTCFLDFDIGGGRKKGRVVVKLFRDKVPLACENFRCLCTGEKGMGRLSKPLCYRFSKVHRIVPKFCVQLGDFTRANGTGGESIYGPQSEHGDTWGKFKDERFMQHSRKGLLSMANSGPNSNGSQFFFTLQATPHLNGKHVVFGEVIEGMDIIEQIGLIQTDTKQCPKEPIVVDNCGELKDGKEVPGNHGSSSGNSFKTPTKGAQFGNFSSSPKPFSFGLPR